MKGATLLTVGLLVLTAVVLQVGFRFDHGAQTPYPSVTFATEFMTADTDVEEWLGPPGSSDRREVGTLQHVDVILIVLYVLTFILLTIQSRSAGSLGALQWACVVVIVGTGMADLLEDRAILTSIGWYSASDIPQDVWRFGVIKWGLLYASTLLLGLVMWRSTGRRRALRAASGVAFVLIGAVGLAALVLGSYTTVGGLLGPWGLTIIVAACAVSL